MSDYLTIESPQNPRVKAAVKLRKKSARQKSGKTLVEGFREILRATENGWKFDELYFCPELFLDTEAPELIAQIDGSGTKVFQCTEPVFRKMAYRETPDGLIALSPLVGRTLAELDLPENPLLLVTEDLEKPGNLGTILRTADATGADAVIVCGSKTDINNPNVIRASIGTLFYLPVVESSTEELIEWLKKQGINSLAAIPDAEVSYTDVDLRGSVAMVVGSEDDGLSEQWKSNATHKVSIPMLGKNDSLNVSTAAALVLYEAVRQRNVAK